MTTTMRAIRPVLEERSGGRCEVCCFPLRPTDAGYFAEHHHRKLRSRGGDDGAANALLTHPGCHAAIHARPGRSTERGHMVSAWADPATTPLIYLGRSALLADDGSVTYLDEGVSR